MEVANKEKQAPAMPSLSVRESWWDVWFCFRRPMTLEIAPKGLSIAGQKLQYWQLSAVEKQEPTWFLPRCLDRGHLVLTYRSGDEERVSSLVLPSNARAQARIDLLQRVHLELIRRLDGVDEALRPVRSDIERVYRSDRYVRHSQASRLANDHSPTIGKMKSIFAWLHRHPLLPPSSLKRAGVMKEELAALAKLVNDPEVSRAEHNERYMVLQTQAEAAYFAVVESSPLTPEQTAAALVFEDATLVIAAAGSGKSSCIVGKIGFALKTGMFQDRQVLALAYNSKAAKSLGDRLSKKLNDAIGRKVSVASKTFHSFGLSVLIEANGEGIRPRVFEEDKGEEGRFLRTVIARLKDEDLSFQQALADWLLFAPFEDPTPFGIAGSVEECARRYEETCRQRIKAKREEAKERYDATIPTLDPAVYVRSLEERGIVNWLVLRGVSFEYEALDWDGATLLGLGVSASSKRRRPYKPDFTYRVVQRLDDGSQREVLIVHEHFALDRNGKAPDWMGGSEYVAQAHSKRAMFKKRVASGQRTGKPVVFFETTSAQFRDGTLWAHLERSLRDSGIKVGAPSKEVYRRAIASFGPIEDREKLIMDFVLRFKDSGLDEKQVFEEAEKQPNSWRARLFLKVAFPVFHAYQQALKDAGKIDFADMLRDALAALRDGRVRTQYRFVLVDEFQDIARLRADLVKSVLDQAPDESVVFCVGDDWQTINRFSGSDVGIFKNIGTHFGRHERQLLLPRTFRCSSGIATLARELVLKNRNQFDKPVDAKPDQLLHCVRVVLHKPGAEHRMLALETQLDGLIDTGKSLGIALPSVQILTRTTAETTAPQGLETEDAIKALKRKYKGKLELDAMSLHGSKGLEADFVVLVGLDSGFRGFPDERETEPLLDLVLPKLADENEEERRLLYVGLTRAKHQVIVLVNGEAPSEYILELSALSRAHSFIEWINLGTQRVPCPKCKVGSLLTHPRNDRRLDCSRSVRCGHRSWIPERSPQNAIP
ncbi:UvrD-helicase domain-containing protein [Xanthomonas sp. LMG 8989]|uniref:UvrD-helicase domain-containing protein n=1 Tax=unclassified Xanthomonas TaxID=2643310 RepID=UPI0031B6D444